MAVDRVVVDSTGPPAANSDLQDIVVVDDVIVDRGVRAADRSDAHSVIVVVNLGVADGDSHHIVVGSGVALNPRGVSVPSIVAIPSTAVDDVIRVARVVYGGPTR